VLSIALYLAPSKYAALALLAAVSLISYTMYGPFFATIQSLVDSRMRATAIAAVYLFSNLIGLGLGPLAAGAISDALRPTFGDESLRYALLILTPGYLWTAVHLWLASRTVKQDLANLSEA
jgi:MFS family permease